MSKNIIFIIKARIQSKALCGMGEVLLKRHTWYVTGGFLEEEANVQMCYGRVLLEGDHGSRWDHENGLSNEELQHVSPIISIM
jgi:hypothetical protein